MKVQGRTARKNKLHDQLGRRADKSHYKASMERKNQAQSGTQIVYS